MKSSDHKWLPEIRQVDCTGCGLCLAACDRQCLELVWDFATLVRAADCGSCGECAAACPRELIHMTWMPASGSHAIGRWRDGASTPPVAAQRRSWLKR
jgi:MinD superfamily P-loop ATPase